MKIYYSIQDHGDDEASAMFFDTERLAEWDNENCDGLGYGELILESIRMITSPQIITAISYYLIKMEYYHPGDSFPVKEFIERFLGGKLPKFSVKFDEEFYYIYAYGVCHYSQMDWSEEKGLHTSEEGCIELERKLNEVQK